MRAVVLGCSVDAGVCQNHKLCDLIEDVGKTVRGICEVNDARNVAKPPPTRLYNTGDAGARHRGLYGSPHLRQLTLDCEFEYLRARGSPQ